VRAGEKSGALVDVLKRFIMYQKRMISVMSKLKMSLAYPIFLVIALIAVLLLFFLYIIRISPKCTATRQARSLF